MPNKKMILGDNPFHNFMRYHKYLYPHLEHISRRYYYPMAGRLYQKWKKFYNNNYYIKNKKNELQSIIDFFDNR